MENKLQRIVFYSMCFIGFLMAILVPEKMVWKIILGFIMAIFTWFVWEVDHAIAIEDEEMYHENFKNK